MRGFADRIAARLGYLGRTGRLAFAGWSALLLAVLAFLPGKGGILLGLLMMHTDGAWRIAGAVGLTLVVCAIKLAWIWAVTVLPTRRMRDMGGKAWLGVLSALFVVNAPTALALVLEPGALTLARFGLLFGWLALLASWPRGNARRETAEVFA